MRATHSYSLSKNWLNILGLYTIRQKEELDSIINSLSNDILLAVKFIAATMEEDFEAYLKASANQSILPGALDKLKIFLADVDKREAQRKWNDRGIAFFAALLKNEQRNITALCDTIISNIVKHLDANQGAFFLHNADEKTLNGISFYAYEKKRFVEKIVSEDEGLVGQCFMENDVIYMTQVPDNYVKITSGLGEATAKYLILIPIKLYEQKLGVIELASFNPFESYQVDFLRTLSENVAGTIVHANNLRRASELLEQATATASALRAKEEVLMQNIEELTAIQEQVTRQNLELEKSKRQLEEKSVEMEKMQIQNMELMESKLKTQEELFQTIIRKLQSKIHSQMTQGVAVN